MGLSNLDLGIFGAGVSFWLLFSAQLLVLDRFLRLVRQLAFQLDRQLLGHQLF